MNARFQRLVLIITDCGLLCMNHTIFQTHCFTQTEKENLFSLSQWLISSRLKGSITCINANRLNVNIFLPDLL